MQDLLLSRLDTIRKASTDLSKSTLKNCKHNLSPVRSAGPAFVLAPRSPPVTTEHFGHDWKTGVTFTDDQKLIATSTLLNPTFVYSLVGEGRAVHDGTDQDGSHSIISPYCIIRQRKKTPSITGLVKSSKASFNDWCSSFESLWDRCVLRFFLGEITAVCAALGAFAGIPAMRWKMSLIQLSSAEYISGSAPHVFIVIDTPNLEHLGLLNIVIAAVMPPSTLCAVSLVLSAQEGATFVARKGSAPVGETEPR